jgi:prepilin-type processing-associated H-X9-DG protein
VLFPNSQVRIQDILDGTTNVMAISEHADSIVQNGTTRVQWQAGSVYGFPMGSTGTDSPPPSYNTTGDNRTFNMTTVLYGINKTNGDGGTGSTWNGVCNDSTRPGVCSGGNNIPLNSAHPGGVNIALCDGSVRFVGNTVPIDVLGRLATRDDNQPLPDY